MRKYNVLNEEKIVLSAALVRGWGCQSRTGGFGSILELHVNFTKLLQLRWIFFYFSLWWWRFLIIFFTVERWFVFSLLKVQTDFLSLFFQAALQECEDRQWRPTNYRRYIIVNKSIPSYRVSVQWKITSLENVACCAQYEVAQETWAVFCRNALWDCFVGRIWTSSRTQAPVVQKLDSAVHRKNRYPMAKFYKNNITLSNG